MGDLQLRQRCFVACWLVWREHILGVITEICLSWPRQPPAAAITALNVPLGRMMAVTLAVSAR